MFSASVFSPQGEGFHLSLCSNFKAGGHCATKICNTVCHWMSHQMVSIYGAEVCQFRIDRTLLVSWLGLSTGKFIHQQMRAPALSKNCSWDILLLASELRYSPSHVLYAGGTSCLRFHFIIWRRYFLRKHESLYQDGRCHSRKIIIYWSVLFAVLLKLATKYIHLLK
jgi:hypothetical protein